MGALADRLHLRFEVEEVEECKEVDVGRNTSDGTRSRRLRYDQDHLGPIVVDTPNRHGVDRHLPTFRGENGIRCMATRLRGIEVVVLAMIE